MTEKIKIADLPDFDITEHLDSDQAIAEYLTIVLEDNDPALLAAALGDIARARGMSKLAKKTGLTREGLYKALSKDSNPSFGTVLRVMHALGLKFTPVVA